MLATRFKRVAVLVFAVVLAAGLTAPGTAADRASEPKPSLDLTAAQTEFLPLEPILITLRVEGEGAALPPGPGESKAGSLRFEVEPAVKPRPGAKPLPLERQVADAQARLYDLFEWFRFPAGTFTVRAVLEQKGSKLTSAPVRFTIGKVAKGDREEQPVARIHHTPWCNYDTDKFCGDTFDLVQTWPNSRLAKYCHYWNGRYSQNKNEHDKAIASFRTVIEKYPEFALADDAEYGIVECLVAQKKLREARERASALQKKCAERAPAEGGKGQTAVQRLVEGMSRRLDRELSRR